MPAAIYQQLRSIPSLIISVVEEGKLLVSFNVTEAKNGRIIQSKNKAYALRCEIRGRTYSFNRKHLDILNQSERRTLYDWLKVDGDELDWGLAID